ncbi:MAG: imidazole glycerol phosphate synthase subunit HisH [Bacteroidetes bacterium]|jgi:glutamine amidotransferase|nr:imidazole glycerol phosphate synthase subunit HisH [Bacteroidota bacterium]
MKTVIIQYNAGNIQSVLYALDRVGVTAIVSDSIVDIQTADKVIFPGVGEASTAMQYLRERNLDEVIKSLKQPVLGICLGMQLLCSHSEENNTTCLGIFEEEVKHFESKDVAIKVPQMGWNTISGLQTDLFKGIAENSFTYCVHGYYATIGADTIATTNYIQNYSSALHKNNFYGVQFHPEKSAKLGEQIIQNFLSL